LTGCRRFGEANLKFPTPSFSAAILPTSPLPPFGIKGIEKGVCAYLESFLGMGRMDA
jgi:hypothetical protein